MRFFSSMPKHIKYIFVSTKLVCIKARSPTRPDWDHRTKVIASSFDNMRAGGGPTGTGESKTVLQSLLGALASAGPQVCGKVIQI